MIVEQVFGKREVLHNNGGAVNSKAATSMTADENVWAESWLTCLVKQQANLEGYLSTWREMVEPQDRMSIGFLLTSCISQEVG